jgi:hypothetical protein
VARRDIDNALFDHLIVAPRERLAPLWKALRGTPGEELLTQVPIDEAEALRLAPAFAARRRGGENGEAAQAEAQWSDSIAANLARAEAQAQGR